VLHMHDAFTQHATVLACHELRGHSLRLGTPQLASRNSAACISELRPHHATLLCPLVLLCFGTRLLSACALYRTWQYDNATAMSAIALAFNAGFTHIDTAESYKNQVRDSVERYGRRIAWPRRLMP
jgi:hypothetical protein